MIALQNDPASILLKSYVPPFRGTWKTLPPHVLPDDVLQDSLNVSLLGGSLRSRCGLRLYTQTQLDSRARGSFMFTGVNTPATPVVATRHAIYQGAGASWVNISTGLTLEAGEQGYCRMTSIQVGLYVYLLYTNGRDPLAFSQELGPFQNVVPFTGTIPLALDICTAASRVIAVTPPYTVSWCDVLNNAYLNFTNWPALNQAILADTEDAIVTIRPLGTLGFAIYKQGNIFVGIAQQGPQSNAFRFEHRGEFEGPGGVNAVVNWNGTHVYMTPSGRVGLFDGAQHQWIADGLWPFIRTSIDSTRHTEIFGVYNYLTSEIYFWYPRVGFPNATDGMVIINTPYPSAGINDFACFLGLSNFDCSHGLSVRLFNGTMQPFVWGQPTHNTYVLDFNVFEDETADFPCHLSTGLFKPPPPQQGAKGGDLYVPTYEVFATRGIGRGSIQLQALTSDQLANAGGLSQVELLDLTRQQPNEYVSFPQTHGKFLGARIDWQSSAQFEYKGCDVYGRRTA